MEEVKTNDVGKYGIGTLIDCLHLNGLRHLGIEAHRQITQVNARMITRGMAATGLAVLSDIFAASWSTGLLMKTVLTAIALLNFTYFMWFTYPKKSYLVYRYFLWEEDYKAFPCKAMAQWAGDVNHVAMLEGELNKKYSKMLIGGVVISGIGMMAAIVSLVV